MKRHNQPMGYTRDAVVAWLDAMSAQGKLPSIDWGQALGAASLRLFGDVTGTG